jgi:hypothetical protein
VVGPLWGLWAAWLPASAPKPSETQLLLVIRNRSLQGSVAWVSRQEWCQVIFLLWTAHVLMLANAMASNNRLPAGRHGMVTAATVVVHNAVLVHAKFSFEMHFLL